ncbi:hypothetical protein CW747_10130 [Staphylococcus shinii]|uniref:hypothetical protein n=1 Tax=Staphylococcus shinii TaxID=2912228 RepID=UPI000C31BADF|nr:hypothetical protein [Staphylococcus shinii]PKI09077.1 hypothetical protein CW747_10130 [Staphylococcus shinii]
MIKKSLIGLTLSMLFVVGACSNDTENKAESEEKESESVDGKEESSEKDTSTQLHTEQATTDGYNTNDPEIRKIMKKDPSTLSENELAIYNGVNRQINNSNGLSESDKAIQADQRAMSNKRNAKSEFEQARIDEQMKQAQGTHKGGTALIEPRREGETNEEHKKRQEKLVEQAKQKEAESNDNKQPQQAQQVQQKQQTQQQPTQEIQRNEQSSIDNSEKGVVVKEAVNTHEKQVTQE